MCNKVQECKISVTAARSRNFRWRASELQVAQTEDVRESPPDELNAIARDANERALLELLENHRISESHVITMLERLDLPAGVIEVIARKGSWNASEPVRVRLASHPRTPKRIAIAALRQLYLLNLARVSLLPSAPADIRRLAEELITARTPHLPLGAKLTLARRGPARVAGALVAEGHPQAIKLALDNPRLTESQLLRVLAKPQVPERVVTAIARHSKWSCQYNLRLALARNPHTPAPVLDSFLPHLKSRDLRDLIATETLGGAARRRVLRELERRNSTGDEVE